MVIYSLPANIFEDIANGIKSVFNSVGQFFTQLANTIYVMLTVVDTLGSAFFHLSLWLPLLTPLFVIFELSILIGALRSI